MNKLDRLASTPMTGNSAEFLAGVYGHEDISLDEFAATMPRQARIIDVGAGLSSFGIEIACRRQDISWINYDIQYDDLNTVAALRNISPANVKYTFGDTMKIPSKWHGQFDRVYSYNYLPHLLRIERELGRRTLQGMVDLLKPDGQLSVGQTHHEPQLRDMAISDKALWLEPVTAEVMITPALNALTIPKRLSRRYDAMDSSTITVFPAQRFKSVSSGHIVSDDGGQTRRRLWTPRGVRLAGKLAAAYVRPERLEDSRSDD